MTTFRAFPAVEIPQELLDRGFTDTSWGNDAMPRVARRVGEGSLEVWVNFEDPAQREVDLGARFGLSVCNHEGGWLMTIARQDHVDDICVVIDAILEYTAT